VSPRCSAHVDCVRQTGHPGAHLTEEGGLLDEGFLQRCHETMQDRDGTRYQCTEPSGHRYTHLYELPLPKDIRPIPDPTNKPAFKRARDKTWQTSTTASTSN
jgi:hypothetical protein